MQVTLIQGLILMGYGITGVFLVLMVFYAAIKLFTVWQARSAQKAMNGTLPDQSHHSQR